VVEPPALYIDLDNVIVGDLSPLMNFQHDFAMLRNFNRPAYPSSCVMWFGKPAPSVVYEKFAANPQHWMDYHEKVRDGPYLGDQAFIWDALGRNVPFIDIPRRVIASYRKDVMARFGGRLPDETIMVAFGGSFKPSTVRHSWLKRAWA